MIAALSQGFSGLGLLPAQTQNPMMALSVNAKPAPNPQLLRKKNRQHENPPRFIPSSHFTPECLSTFVSRSLGSFSFHGSSGKENFRGQYPGRSLGFGTTICLVSNLTLEGSLEYDYRHGFSGLLCSRCVWTTLTAHLNFSQSGSKYAGIVPAIRLGSSETTPAEAGTFGFVIALPPHCHAAILA